MTQQLPTGLSLAQINLPPTADQWNDTELTVAQQLGLPTTSWEDGGVERTIFAIVANMQMQADVAGSIAIQGGFLNFAAFGTVTWTDATGVQNTVFVTPDPSIPSQNPTGALGWLDVLADGLYDVQRILSGPAGGALAILNTQATTYGPFDVDSFFVSQPGATGAPTYHNTVNFTLPQSTTLGSVTSTASSTGAIRLNATGTWTVGQVVFVVVTGATLEANGAWTVSATDGTTYIVLSGSTFVNAGATTGTIYAPTVTTFTADVNGTGSSATPNTVTHAVTSLVGVSVSNYASWIGQDTEGNASVVNRCGLKLQSISPNGPRGAYLYAALTAITLAPTLNPPKVVSTAIVSAVASSSAGVVTVTIANAAGQPSAEDVDAVDAVIQAYAVPIATTETTQACTNLNVTVAMTIYVPKASVDAVVPIVQVAVQAYLVSVPVGGLSDPGGASNVIPINGFNAAVTSACNAAQIVPQDITSTLNGAATNLAVGATQKPVMANATTFVPTVIGV